MRTPKPFPIVKVAVCIPSQDDWRADFGISLAQMFGYSCRYADIELQLVNYRGSVIQEVRTGCAKAALMTDAEWMLWLDSDMIFPPATLLQLLSHRTPIAAAAAVARRDQTSTASVLRDNLWYKFNPPKRGTVCVDGVGFGCILIRREVFEKIQEPWFDTEWRPTPSGLQILGEDFFFCVKATQAGYKILVDCALSHNLGHVGSTVHAFRVGRQSGHCGHIFDFMRLCEQEAENGRTA